MLSRGANSHSMKNLLFKWAARVFTPDVAANMAREGTMDANAPESADEEFMIVEDNGSDVTVFCWAGMAVLFAGMPAFEFRKLLKSQDDRYNLVFFRDLRRIGYMEKPDGSDGGIDFFQQKCQEVMDRLGSRHNVCIGASAGATTAIFFAARMKMQHVIAFGPIFDADLYTHWKQQLRHYFNFKCLFTEPQAWFEVIMMMLGGHVVKRKMRKRFGEEAISDVLAAYRNAQPRPKATVFHGKYCLPDRVQAHLLDPYPEVEYLPVETGRHNVAAILKRQGILADSIVDAIHRGIEERGLPSTESPQKAAAAGK
jgi:hypothetical protein